MEALEGPEFTPFDDVVSLRVTPDQHLSREERSVFVLAEPWTRFIEGPPR